MSVDGVYLRLQEKSCAVLQALLADNDSIDGFTKAHNFLSDFGAIGSALEGRYEAELVDLAIKEYEFALFAVSMGNYRSAFAGLRLSFEMNLATIYFSAHEVEYRLWLMKAKDIKWNVLTSPEGGVFSPVFSTAFNNQLADEQKHYQGLATTVYRECSEYVHGNAHTHANLPRNVEYDKDVVANWCEMASTMHHVTIFAFALRYVQNLERRALSRVESVVLDSLGHLSSIRLAYQATA